MVFVEVVAADSRAYSELRVCVTKEERAEFPPFRRTFLFSHRDNKAALSFFSSPAVADKCHMPWVAITLLWLNVWFIVRCLLP